MLNKDRVPLEIATFIAKYLSKLKPNAETRPCLHCGKVFRLTRSNKFYCKSKCSRAAHYLRFQIRNIGD